VHEAAAAAAWQTVLWVLVSVVLRAHTVQNKATSKI
jgi:hypothetical protein